MVEFFNLILAKVVAFADWIGLLVVDVFVSLWEVLTDLFCWVLDESLGFVVTSVEGLDVSGISSAVGAFGSIPANTLEVLAALGAGEALAIISAALAIRFLLQLIPFVRLGS